MNHQKLYTIFLSNLTSIQQLNNKSCCPFCNQQAKTPSKSEEKDKKASEIAVEVEHHKCF